MVNWENKRVLVTGAKGFVGSHLCDKLKEIGCQDIIEVPSHPYDLRVKTIVRNMFKDAGKLDYVFNLAAKVGGIGYNQRHPYSLFYDNILINLNMIDEARQADVGKFIQVGTTCSYPKFTTVPFNEKEIWDGYPEETNAPYGIAKRASLIQIQSARKEHGFNGIYLIPTNLYGPRDEFNPSKSHVIPALIRKCINATLHNDTEIEVWGTGNASRDFLYVKDLVEALILAAEKYESPEPLNIGSGIEVKISTLVYMIQQATGFEGYIRWNTSKPDGQPRRRLSIHEATNALWWEPTTVLKDGLAETVKWYREEELQLVT